MFHSATKAFHRLFDIFFAGIGKAQAKLLLSSAIDVEWLADHKGNALVGCLTQERARAQVARQATPEMEAALWLANANFARPVGADCLEHEITFRLVAGAQFAKMLSQQIAPQTFRNRPLTKRVGIQVEDLRSIIGSGAANQATRRPGARILEKVLR